MHPTQEPPMPKPGVAVQVVTAIETVYGMGYRWMEGA